MNFEKTEVWGFEHAIRGMRNPLNSHDRSDSDFSDGCHIGLKDMELAQRLIRAGSEHRKFLRQIFVSVDITAPLFWWKEFSTYKVGTVANSTSTMHKLTSQPIALECFEVDDYETFDDRVQIIIQMCEDLRQKYIGTKDKRYWKELVRWLPNSWLQTRTVTMSYENVLNMVNQRKNHKLNEWSGKDNNELPNFISWAKTLPYADELLFLGKDGE